MVACRIRLGVAASSGRKYKSFFGIERVVGSMTCKTASQINGHEAVTAIRCGHNPTGNDIVGGNESSGIGLLVFVLDGLDFVGIDQKDALLNGAVIVAIVVLLGKEGENGSFQHAPKEGHQKPGLRAVVGFGLSHDFLLLLFGSRNSLGVHGHD